MNKATIDCDGIYCNAKAVLDMPQGWNDFEHSGEGFFTFCPDCQLQAEWRNSQCTGCVSSMPDCAFADALYCERPEFNKRQRAQIEAGICPFRINGTLMMDVRPDGSLNMSSLDMSDAAPEAGKAMLVAVDAYRAHYCKEDN